MLFYCVEWYQKPQSLIQALHYQKVLPDPHQGAFIQQDPTLFP